jgi:hypothetical protein
LVYDSTTSQHKNYTIAEAKAARDRLYQAIQDGRHISGILPRIIGLETDRAALAALMQFMSQAMRDMRESHVGCHDKLDTFGPVTPTT